MAQVYLGLGSNIGNKAENLQKVTHIIEMRIGKIIASSAFYETRPWGYISENSFLNSVIQIETNILPQQILTITQQIEKEMGRGKKNPYKRYEDRLIDIDILFYDDLVYSNHVLTIPHPLIEKRDFVLNPLHEIAPEFVHPISKKKIYQLKNELSLEENRPKPSHLKQRINSFKYAFNGFRILLQNEYNARIHALAGIIVIILGFLFKISLVEWMVLIFLVGIVFMAEIFNTIFEYLIDYISPTYKNQIKKIKDLGAAAVLVVALTAIILGLLIFLPKIWMLFFS